MSMKGVLDMTNRIQTARLEQALKDLNALIKEGREFPDAVFCVSYRSKVKVETLTQAYDEQFN